MRVFLISICTILILATHCTGLPKRWKRNDADGSLKSNSAGLSSQIVATNLLKDKINSEENYVFSPLGISSLLAILAEGAREDTYKEFMTALAYPENKLELRESFKSVLKNFRQDLMELKSPSFKTWFYIYRNNTARDEYKNILRDYYFVEVKDIDRNPYGWSEQKSESSPLISSTLSPSPSSTNSKDVIEFEELKKSKPFDDVKHKSEIVEQRDVSKFDKIVEDKQYVEVPVIKDEKIEGKEVILDDGKDEKKEFMGEQMKDKQQEIIKVINQDVDKKMKMENKEKIPLIRVDDEKMNKNNKNNDDKLEMKDTIISNPENVQLSAVKPSDVPAALIPSVVVPSEQNLQENETIKDDEKLEAYKKDVENSKPLPVGVASVAAGISNEPEKFSLPLKKLEESEIFHALENHFMRKRFSGGRTLFQKDDVASALSANSLVSRSLPNQTRMLLFNGLYYRGNWAYPFQELKSGTDDMFHLSSDKKIPVTMMRTRGNYRIADLKGLDAKAIEFPYENRQYSLLIFLPREKDGLRTLIKNLEPRDITQAKSSLSESMVDVSLPKFCVEQTTRSEDTLKRLGLKKIFSLESEHGLEDIAEGQILNVDEIVQHVNLRVDEGATSQNILAASILARGSESGSRIDGEDEKMSSTTLSGVEEKEIIVDRPFLYFILDNENDFVIIAGKVLEPKLLVDDM